MDFNNTLKLTSSPDSKHHHRVLLYGVAVCFILIIALGVGYLSGVRSVSSSANNHQVLLTPLSPFPTPSDSNSQEFRFRPLSFSMLKRDVPQGQLATFSDDYLGISFSYPKRYKLFPLKATKKDPFASLYFLKYPDTEIQNLIEGVISCEERNRVDPSGLCTEDYISDLDITISKTTNANVNTSSETDPYCDVKRDTNKTIYSCLAFNIASSPVYKYAIVINKNNEKYGITMIIHNAYSVPELIWTIGESFTTK